MPALKTLDDARALVEKDDSGKHDHVVRVRELSLLHGRLFVPNADDEGFGLAFTPWATAQACQRLGIPSGYFNRCPDDLKDHQFNYWKGEEAILKRIYPDDPDAASWLVRAKDWAVRGV